MRSHLGRIHAADGSTTRRSDGLIIRRAVVRIHPGPLGDKRRGTAKPCKPAGKTACLSAAPLRLASARTLSHTGSRSHLGRIGPGRTCRIESNRPDWLVTSARLCTAMQTRIAEPRQRANERTALHVNRDSVMQP